MDSDYNPYTHSWGATALPGIDAWGAPAAPKKPAKRNWADDLHNTVQDITARGDVKSSAIEAEEQRRRQESLATLKGASASLDQPWLTDLDIRRMYTGKSNDINRTFRGNMQGLRTAVGASGVAPDSGAVSALADRYAASRSASLTDATLSLYEKRIDLDVQRRLAKIAAENNVAAKQGEDPSMIGMDWLGASGNLALGEGSVYAGLDAAKTAAKAGKKSGFEQVLSALPVLGGLFG